MNASIDIKEWLDLTADRDQWKSRAELLAAELDHLRRLYIPELYPQTERHVDLLPSIPPIPEDDSKFCPDCGCEWAQCHC